MESEKMELRLINPNESGFLQHIEWNSEEIRKQVQMMMSAYTDVVYTEDTMKAAKDDRATLNKFKKVIEDRRKEVKKKCMEPYEQFEKEVKEITALIDKPIGMIDSQIKEYEEKQKAEKKSQIQAAYDESIGDFGKDLPFETEMNEIIFEIVKLVVMVAALVIARYLVPFVKNKIGASKLELIAQWAKYAVLKAQQVLWSESGEDRKAYVTEFLKKLLIEKNISISDEQLDILIEAAVKQMKIAENSGITIEATDAVPADDKGTAE